MLGDFEITALSDGAVKLPVKDLLEHHPGKVDAALKKATIACPSRDLGNRLFDQHR